MYHHSLISLYVCTRSMRINYKYIYNIHNVVFVTGVKQGQAERWAAQWVQLCKHEHLLVSSHRVPAPLQLQLLRGGLRAAGPAAARPTRLLVHGAGHRARGLCALFFARSLLILLLFTTHTCFLIWGREGGSFEFESPSSTRLNQLPMLQELGCSDWIVSWI